MVTKVTEPCENIFFPQTFSRSLDKNPQMIYVKKNTKLIQWNPELKVVIKKKKPRTNASVI